MADGLVTCAVGRIEKLLSTEERSLSGIRCEVGEFVRLLKRFRLFVEERRWNLTPSFRGQMVEETTELAFRAEDVIDMFLMKEAEWENKSALEKAIAGGGITQALRMHKLQKEIKYMHTRLSRLIESRSKFLSLSFNRGLSCVAYSRRPVHPKIVVGVDEKVKGIISELKKDEGCQVVSICGMGGVGKTTVCSLIYEHPEIIEHFQARAWCSVSQEFDKLSVLRSLLSQLLPEDRRIEIQSSWFVRALESELSKFLQQNRCLIVIDDIWTTDAWESLVTAFPIGGLSKLLVTSRDQRVAGVGSYCTLSCLTDEEAWELLAQLTFPQDSVNGVPLEMELIGRQLVSQCKGLPLAVSTLGGMLRGKELSQWKLISDQHVSFYRASDRGVYYQNVRHVLGRSYESLDSRLRQCFLCLSNYKGGEEIFVEELYRLWLGEGLISFEDKEPGESMMDVAERHLEELAHRCLVQVKPWPISVLRRSKFLHCRIHDLTRDMLLSKMKEVKVIRVIGSQHMSESENHKIRRLCVHPHHKMESVDENLLPKIRSLLLSKDIKDSGDEIFRLDKYKLLRVLVVDGFRLDMASLSRIGRLLHMTYLSLRRCVVAELPSSIGNLRFLETLDLKVSGQLGIPNVLCRLNQLRHLYLPDSAYVIGGGNLRLDGLKELELLEGFNSGFCEAVHLFGSKNMKIFAGRIGDGGVETMSIIQETIEFLKSNPLCSSTLDIVSSEEGGLCFGRLLECGFVNSLSINSPIFIGERHHSCFSKHLTHLHLLNCKIVDSDPMKYLEQLPNLSSLCFDKNSYVGKEMTCSSRGFPKLQYLGLMHLQNLTTWRIDQGAMPNLSELIICCCHMLEVVPKSMFLTALRKISISGMPREFSDRAARMYDN